MNSILPKFKEIHREYLNQKEKYEILVKNRLLQNNDKANKNN